MKINHIKRITFCLLASCLLIAESGQAQTSSELTKSASPMEAAIYPLVGASPAIKINFNNRTGGGVRLVIQKQDGTAFYDEWEHAVHYRRQFDLSDLPAGHYMVKLSKGDYQYTQTFIIEQPIEKRIELGQKAAQSDNRKLAVNQ